MIREDMFLASSTAIHRESWHRLTACKGWASNFIERQALRSVSLSGEADSTNMDMVAADMARLRQKLADCDANRVLDVDEIGLFLNCIHAQHISALLKTKGLCAIHAKERITEYVCTNSTGTHSANVHHWHSEEPSVLPS